MSPVPKATFTPLPLSRSALNALHSLRTVQDSAARNRLLTSILAVAATDTSSPSTTTLDNPKLLSPHQYLLQRLLNGVAASARSVRLNYTLALATLLQSQTPIQRAETIAAAVNLYTDAKQFNASVPAVARQRALASLSFLTALAPQADGIPTAAAVRDAARLLRLVVQPLRNEWRLGPPAARVFARFLYALQPRLRQAVVKNVWAVVAANPAAYHSLAFALTMLLDYKLVSPSAVHTLYPSVDGDFQRALTTTFSSGFSIFDSALSEGKDGRHNMVRVVGPLWPLAIRYVSASREVCSMQDVGLDTFWNDVVVQHLLSRRSLEKRLFAILLLPTVVKYLSATEQFASIFTEQLARAVLAIIEDGKVVRRGNEKQTNVRAVVAVRIAMRDVADFISMSSSSDGNGARMKQGNMFVLPFWKWAMRFGVARASLQTEVLAERLKSLSKTEVAELFTSGVYEFAAPVMTTSGNSGQSTSWEVSQRRIDIASFLLKLAAFHEGIAKDVVRVLTLYCACKMAAVSGDSDGNVDVSFDVLKLQERSYGGLLPSVTSAIQESVASSVAKSMGVALCEMRDDRAGMALARVALDTFHLAVREGTGLEARRPGEDGVTKMLICRVLPLSNKLQNMHVSGEEGAVRDALHCMCIHVGVGLMEVVAEGRTAGKRKNGKRTHVKRDVNNIERLLERMEECYSSIGKEKMEDPDSRHEVIGAESIERITHLTCDMCGNEGPRFMEIGTKVMKRLHEFLDDRVTAVLFDAMDTYRKGVEQLGDNVADGDDIEDGEEGEEQEASDGEDEYEEDGDEEDGEVEGMDNVGVDDDSDSDGVDDSDDDGVDENDDVSGDVESEDRGKGVMMVDGEGRSGMDGGSDDEPVDIDMDIDEEDPKVLQALDKHLSRHLLLVRQQRVTKRAKKAQEDTWMWRVARIMKLVDKVASMLRLRLDEDDAVVGKERRALVLVDVMTRLYEFLFSEEADNLRTVKAVNAIVSKQICSVNVTVLTRCIGTGGVESVVEATDKLLRGLMDCKHGVSLEDEDVRVLSSALGLLMSLCVSASEDVEYSRFAGMYEEMVGVIMGDGVHVCCAGVMGSFLIRGGVDVAVKVAEKVVMGMEGEGVGRKKRQRAVEILEVAGRCVRQVTEGEGNEMVGRFWLCVTQFVRRFVKKETVKKEWSAEGMMAVAKVAAAAHSVPQAEDGEEDLRTVVWEAVQAMEVDDDGECNRIGHVLGVSKRMLRDGQKAKKKKRRIH